MGNWPVYEREHIAAVVAAVVVVVVGSGDGGGGECGKLNVQ